MKNSTRRIVALLLGLCLPAFGLVACDSQGDGDDTKVPETETVAFMDGYKAAINIEPYRTALSADSQNYLLLVNKQHALSSTYAPATLSSIDPTLTLGGKSLQLEATAAKAAEAMIRELQARGYTDIVMTSAYRDYDYQSSLFNRYINEELAAHPGWTRAEAEALVATYSAKPGTSEHQSGLCMDLISARDCVLDESFANNPAYDWLIENAHCFGFILRYPQGKDSITGYSYEPWHYRFVGVEAATAIHDRGLTLEQYLGE